MENLRKRIKIRVVEKKISLTLNKPIYVGFTVLEISKWKIYNFHYNFMIRKFNTILLFTDTDSLCYEIYGKKPHNKIYNHKELYDLTNLPVSSKYYCSDNNNVVGKMKDEYGGKSILKFIGLKSKMYSILDESNNEKSPNKGHITFIEFQEFHDALFKKKILRHTREE